ncbi:MAG TPA: SagB/ThcOx family dehydrogenase [Anaerolineaceae bacterium]
MTPSVGSQFMHETEVARLEPSEQSRGLPQPPLELPAPEGAPRIRLPRPETLTLGRVDLIDLVNSRRSRRKHGLAPVSLEELSFLLWCCQGVERITDRPATLRTVPSAGARHAFETLLLANRVTGLEPGLYRFLAVEHELARLPSPPDLAGQLTAACRQQEHIRTSAVTFIWTAVLARMRWRYGERGYRYLHLDAGHACQNLYLAAEAVGCGACAVGGFYDDLVNPLLGLDGEEQFAVYLCSVGKRK